MGLLDKIFGSSKQPVTQNDVSERKNLYDLCMAKYKMLESEGKEIDLSLIQDTSCEPYPYPCATEAEQKHLNSYDKQVLRNDATSIVHLIVDYTQGVFENYNRSDITIYKDFDKANYWKNILIKGAESGNRSFQAALITDGYFCDEWNPENERIKFKEKYESSLFLDAKNGSSKARYAVAQFELDGAIRGSDKKKEYLESAARDGYGDAYYLLAQDFQRIKEWDEKIYINYGDENSCYFYSLYLKGANTDNGAFVGIMQDRVADCYNCGECGFPEDLNKAKYYYKLAIKNGVESAKISLEYLRR